MMAEISSKWEMPKDEQGNISNYDGMRIALSFFSGWIHGVKAEGLEVDEHGQQGCR